VIGDAVLYHGDCLEVMPTLADDSVDLVLTDIPYGVVNRASAGLRNLDKGVADVLEFDMARMLSEVVRLVSGSVYIFCGTEQVSEIRGALVAASMSTRLGIWHKTNPSPMNGQHIWLSGIECCVFAKKRGSVFNEHCRSPVWRHATARGKLHPTMKPLSLMVELIEASSDSGMVVLDPFMGSGTTGVACANLGRKFIGIELDEDYFNIAAKRIKTAHVQGKLFQ